MVVEINPASTVYLIDRQGNAVIGVGLVGVLWSPAAPPKEEPKGEDRVRAFPGRVLIAGTDRGVGKTIVSASLAASCIGEVLAVKPVSTGVPKGEPCADAEFVADVAGHDPMNLYSWIASCSPYRASIMEGEEAALGEVLAWVRELQARALLVESCGGWREPIGPGWGTAEIATGLGYPILLVAEDRRGAVAQVLSTVETIHRDGGRLMGVVLNKPRYDATSGECARLCDLQEMVPHLPVVGFPALETLARASLANAGRALRRDLGY